MRVAIVVLVVMVQQQRRMSRRKSRGVMIMVNYIFFIFARSRHETTRREIPQRPNAKRPFFCERK